MTITAFTVLPAADMPDSEQKSLATRSRRLGAPARGNWRPSPQLVLIALMHDALGIIAGSVPCRLKSRASA